ncbi:MAG: hypothetical protein QG628_995 [Patescibacteria group bacterium]|nr:hypothetical protein [Patescibacteria group bacterium]
MWLESLFNMMRDGMVAALGVNSVIASSIAVFFIGAAIAVPLSLLAYGVMKFFEGGGDALRSGGVGFENLTEGGKIALANGSEGWKNFWSAPLEAVKSWAVVTNARIAADTESADLTVVGNTGRQTSLKLKGPGSHRALRDTVSVIPATAHEVYGTDYNKPLSGPRNDEGE